MEIKSSSFFKSFQKCMGPLYFYKVLILLQVLLGRYFSLSKSKLTRFFTKLYCVFMYIHMIYKWNDVVLVSHKFVLPPFIMSEYTGYFVISIILSEDYFFNFCDNLLTNDRVMGFKNIPHVPPNVIGFMLITVISRVAFVLTRHFTVSLPSVHLIYVTVLLISLDLSHIYTCVIFCMIQLRMKVLRCFLENIHIPINIVSGNEVEMSIKNVRKSLYYYNNLLDSMAAIDKHTQCMVSKLYLHQ
ncbi:hypothetical protein B5X24_HaOG200954 [Helicoverpa armigera]|uniref:Gustatory receptor n=1 Tax=Helicoverpa armigera TaxID=29058 RepID=A0A2W1B434_HELAM|nr:hypothetical protein B5X24_HaOG200954 [Helicoverpa armigera]